MTRSHNYAVGAKTADNPPRGIGIARFNQNSDDLTKAEFAIIVADRFQGKTSLLRKSDVEQIQKIIL